MLSLDQYPMNLRFGTLSGSLLCPFRSPPSSFPVHMRNKKAVLTDLNFAITTQFIHSSAFHFPSSLNGLANPTTEYRPDRTLLWHIGFLQIKTWLAGVRRRSALEVLSRRSWRLGASILCLTRTISGTFCPSRGPPKSILCSPREYNCNPELRSCPTEAVQISRCRPPHRVHLH